MNKKGFTLVELMITIAIIGILAMIAIPGYVGQQKRATRAEAFSNLQNLRLLEEQYFADRGCYYMEGATPVCTNKTLTGVAAIQAFLSGFKPGAESSLNYTYKIAVASDAGGSVAGAFTASAIGKSGTRGAGDTFTIDNSNNRNF
jgi:type IV pilus assembly protein PilE